MLIVAVTGGIGSGKSTVAELFRQRRVPVIDTDAIARELVQPGQAALAEIINTFGDAYKNSDGSLNRRALREMIFADEQARTTLESILHPRIHAAVLDQLNKLDANYCLVIIPLLATSTYTYPYDRVLFVDVTTDTQLQRTTARDAQDQQVTRQMIAAQADRDTLLTLADDVIDNNGNLTELAAQVARLHEKYLALSHSGAKTS